MNLDIQIVYIFILIFTCLVLLCISLMYLYISVLNKYTKVKDDPIINNAKRIADKIVDSTKNYEDKYDEIMAKLISDITSKWQSGASEVLTKNIKILDEELKKKVMDVYKKDVEDLDLFKKEKMNEFEGLVSEYVIKMGKDIIKKEIDINDHKRLISEGLERAKKVGLFK